MLNLIQNLMVYYKFYVKSFRKFRNYLGYEYRSTLKTNSRCDEIINYVFNYLEQFVNLIVMVLVL